MVADGHGVGIGTLLFYETTLQILKFFKAQFQETV
jgi:hypothetical protein